MKYYLYNEKVQRKIYNRILKFVNVKVRSNNQHEVHKKFSKLSQILALMDKIGTSN